MLCDFINIYRYHSDHKKGKLDNQCKHSCLCKLKRGLRRTGRCLGQEIIVY